MSTRLNRVTGGSAAASVAVAAVVGCGSSGADVEYTAYNDDHFTIEVPEAWEAQEDTQTQEEEYRIHFSHPNGDYRIQVDYWSAELPSASAHLRELADANLASADDPDNETSAYEQIEIRREDPGGLPDGWDVAFYEYTHTNDTWTTPERHVATQAVSVGGQENYSIAFTVPAEAAEDYSGVWEHVFDSFEPR